MTAEGVLSALDGVLDSIRAEMNRASILIEHACTEGDWDTALRAAAAVDVLRSELADLQAVIGSAVVQVMPHREIALDGVAQFERVQPHKRETDWGLIRHRIQQRALAEAPITGEFATDREAAVATALTIAWQVAPLTPSVNARQKALVAHEIAKADVQADSTGPLALVIRR